MLQSVVKKAKYYSRRMGLVKDAVADPRQDMESYRLDIIRQVQPFTMTSVERIYHLIASVEYVIQNNLPGAFVECGVWKGGSMMTVAITLGRLGDTSRELYLYDTYDGMTSPDENDVRHDGTTAKSILAKSQKNTDNVYWAYSPLDEVRRNMLSTGYPESKLHFIKGKVEDTIPDHIPESIALLRLDTDWYESTKHELEHLYPRLTTGGPFIIDDYGWWKGSRKAVDEYLTTLKHRPLLHRIDNNGRAGTKT